MAPPTQRLRVTVRGAVQGVGFRPFVYRLATDLGLHGWVRNSTQGVVIEVEGATETLEDFRLRLEREGIGDCIPLSVSGPRTSHLGNPSVTVGDRHVRADFGSARLRERLRSSRVATSPARRPRATFRQSAIGHRERTSPTPDPASSS